MKQKYSDEVLDYDEAFMRNIGLVSREEQARIREFTIAIPGMGGVGGTHLISLVRQGFEKFKIADIDEFETKNMNRQFGARPDTVGRPKVDVMREEALKVNPNCEIEVFNQGVNRENVGKFLEGVDLAVDSVDIFEVDTHQLFCTAAQERGIPVVFAAPIGFGAVFITYDPNGPSFSDYFHIDKDMPYNDKLARFLMGSIPSMLQRTYMLPDNVSLKEQRGPSSIGSVNICSGIMVINTLKILLKRGEVKSLPHYHQFDVMRNKYVVKRLWFGNRNPIQRLKIFIAKRMYKID